jgi:hypothetical protein
MKKTIYSLLFVILSPSWLWCCLTIKDKEQIQSEIRNYVAGFENLEWDSEIFMDSIEKISASDDCLVWIKGIENSIKQPAESINETFKKLFELRDQPQGKLWKDFIKLQSGEAFSADDAERFYRAYQKIKSASVDFVVKTREGKLFAIVRFSRLNQLDAPDLLLPVYIKNSEQPRIFEKSDEDFDMNTFEFINALQELLMIKRLDIYNGLLKILSRNFSEK